MTSFSAPKHRTGKDSLASYQPNFSLEEKGVLREQNRQHQQKGREKKGRAMHEKLADELLAAYKGEGSAVKKREEMHKMAEANRAFAHYRW